jgi:hypothetical protein
MPGDGIQLDQEQQSSESRIWRHRLLHLLGHDSEWLNSFQMHRTESVSQTEETLYYSGLKPYIGILRPEVNHERC